MGNPVATTRIERSHGRFILSLLSEHYWMGADKSVRSPLHPHYRRDSGCLCHQQTLGSSQRGGGERRLRQVSADGKAKAEVSHREPAMVSSLLTRGWALHGQWVCPKRTALIQLAQWKKNIWSLPSHFLSSIHLHSPDNHLSVPV